MRCEIGQTGLVLFPEGLTEQYAVANWTAAGMPMNRQAATKAPPTAAEAGQVNGATTVAKTGTSERDQVKAELTALGITFKPQTRIDTLKTLLENATGGNVQDKADITHMKDVREAAAPVDDGIFDTTPAAPPAVEYKAEDVKNALLELSKTKGLEKAKTLLNTFDGAESVSKLDPKHYAACVEAAKKG